MPQFASKDEEITYWKERSDELDKELEEFREQSHMLEKELEASLEQADRTIRDLRIRNNRLQLENDTLRVSESILCNCFSCLTVLSSQPLLRYCSCIMNTSCLEVSYSTHVC